MRANIFFLLLVLLCGTMAISAQTDKIDGYFKAEADALSDGHHGANGALARWLSESVSYGINRLELVTQTVAIWNHIREWLRRLLNPLTIREEPPSARRSPRAWQECRSRHR